MTITNDDDSSNANNCNGNDIPDKNESQEKFLVEFGGRKYFRKGFQIHMKRLCTGRTRLCYQVE